MTRETNIEGQELIFRKTHCINAVTHMKTKYLSLVFHAIGNVHHWTPRNSTTKEILSFLIPMSPMTTSLYKCIRECTSHVKQTKHVPLVCLVFWKEEKTSHANKKQSYSKITVDVNTLFYMPKFNITRSFNIISDGKKYYK